MSAKAPSPPRIASQPSTSTGTARPAPVQTATAATAERRARLAPRITMGAQASQKAATWGLIMMPAPAARPPHASGTRASPGPQRLDHGHVNQVDAGEIHVEDVAVRHRALGDEPGDVVHEGGIVDERPAQGAPDEIEGEAGASDQNRLQSLARRSG